jgi:thiamine-phosphate pyrophosphorylase
MKIKGFYFVTDSKLSKQGIFSDAEQAIVAGCKIIQYRENKKSSKEMLEEALQLKKICAKKNVLFIVNNRVDIALAANADGVHLGQDDLPLAVARKLLGKKIIGVTAHSAQEAIVAEKQGADYVSASAIFATTTKKDAGKPKGIELITELKQAVKIPVVAIGGINEENLQPVLEAGADSIVMISAILNSDNVKETVARVVERINCFQAREKK